jgi:hypothetical protein
VSAKDRKPAFFSVIVAGGSRQAVELRHHQHVTGVELVEQPAKLRPVGLVTLRHIADDAAPAGFPQRRDLASFALAAGRYPCLAVNHGFILQQTSAPKKHNDLKAPSLVRNY